MKKRLKNFLLYGGVSHEDYIASVEYYREYNRKALFQTNVLLLIALVVLTFFIGPGQDLEMVSTGVLVAIPISIILVLLSYFAQDRFAKATVPLKYLTHVYMLALTIGAGSFYCQDEKSVLIIVYMFVIPSLYYTRPINCSATIFLTGLVYVIFAYLYKTPAAFLQDLRNVIIYGSIAITLGVIWTSTKMKGRKLHDELEYKQKELEYKQQIEEALDTAEKANKSKTTFLFNMSHDIRTPMNAIIGYTAMAKKNTDTPIEVVDSLEKIDVASKQLLSLVNQVLEMSRIESGKIVFDNKPMNIIKQSNEILSIVETSAKEKDITITSSISGIQNEMVSTDISRFSQIILNIIGNALKYTPEGGKISYSLTETDSKDGKSIYTVVVEDTGIGMSQEFLKTIFEEFSRENTSTVSKIQGTGLGMSIVKRIVDLMNGNISIESEQGKGTKVTISLPLEHTSYIEEEKEDNNTEINIANMKGKKILLVEDNEMNREIAKDILEESGFIIDEADDGTVAVEKMNNATVGQYDLILMDIQMPIMNGYEATKHIREISDPEISKIPIIAMTANAFEEDRKAAFEAGMDEHIAKPVDINKLLVVLSKFVK